MMLFLGQEHQLSLFIAILYFKLLTLIKFFHWLCVGVWVGRWLGTL